MMNHFDPINRLNTYFNFFSSGLLISISDISLQSRIPIEIIRDDFSLLLSQNALFEFDEKHEDIYAKIDNHLNSFIADFNCGKYDHIPLCLNLPQLKNEQIFIDLTKDEIIAFNKFFQTDISDKNVITVKKDYNHNYTYTNLSNLLTTINNAILNKNSISLIYKLENGLSKNLNLYPLKILHDKSSNLFTLLSLDEKQCISLNRFDCIKEIHITNSKNVPIPTKIIKILPNVWNNSFTDKPFKTKVRFRNEANIFKKVKRDLACRTNGLLYEKDGFLYYEDVIYGLEAFKNYIFSYGRSAIVLEPKELQDSIIESLIEKKKLYIEFPFDE